MFAMKVLVILILDSSYMLQMRCGAREAACDLAVQVMEKEKIMKSQSQIRHANNEKMIMMGLEHPNIVRLWYSFQTPSKMYALAPSPAAPLTLG